MKKLFIFAVILLLAFAGTALAQTKLALTKHDLSSAAGTRIKASDTDQVCIFCHTPHKGSPASRRPLWNHEVTSQTLTWSPTKTTRGTLLPTALTNLAGSQACLSCHDGTIALGSVLVYYDPAQSKSVTKTFTVTGTGAPAGQLTSASSAFIDPAAMSSNHPIGVTRPDDKTGYTPFKASPTADAQGVDYDAGGYVQCQSCHNPHLYSVIEAPFLRKVTTGSALCLTCHDL